MHLMHLFGVIVLLVSNVPFIFCYNYSDIDRLFEDKLSSYNKNIRPLINQSEAITIYVGFELITVIELDEVLEKITVNGVLFMSWKDELMVWDPENYGGASNVFTESENFWTPNVALLNTFEKIEKLGEKWTIVRYSADGTAAYSPGQIFSASCSVDITYFPWDVQTCEFNFMPFGLTRSEVNLVTLGEKVGLRFFSPNGVWDVVDTSASVTYVFADFSITLKRKPQFVIANVILPIMIMSFLNIVVFWIPTESGERISYCLTVLLSIAVFLTLVGDNLPKTSTPMAMLSYYLLSILILSVCVTFSIIFSLRLHFRDEDITVSQFWTCIVRFTRCDRGCGRPKINPTSILVKSSSTGRPYTNGSFHGNSPSNVKDAKVHTKTHSDNWTMQRDNITNIKDEHHTNNKHMEIEMDNECSKSFVKNKITLKEVSDAVDKICFVFYTLVLTTFTTIFVLVASRTI